MGAGPPAPRCTGPHRPLPRAERRVGFRRPRPHPAGRAGPRFRWGAGPGAAGSGRRGARAPRGALWAGPGVSRGARRRPAEEAPRTARRPGGPSVTARKAGALRLFEVVWERPLHACASFQPPAWPRCAGATRPRGAPTAGRGRSGWRPAGGRVPSLPVPVGRRARLGGTPAWGARAWGPKDGCSRAW